jgi:hypothetical protein
MRLGSLDRAEALLWSLVAEQDGGVAVEEQQLGLCSNFPSGRSVLEVTLEAALDA